MEGARGASEDEAIATAAGKSEGWQAKASVGRGRNGQRSAQQGKVFNGDFPPYVKGQTLFPPFISPLLI